MIDKLVELIERFFLDLVGTITPGILFVGGWILLTGGVWPAAVASPSFARPMWWIWLPLTYAIGHLLTAVGEFAVVPIARRVAASKRGGKIIRPPGYLMQREDLKDRPSIATIRAAAPGLDHIDAGTLAGQSALRNIALTMVASENRSTTVRFMSIALFSLGTATASLLLAMGYAIWAEPRQSIAVAGAALLVAFLMIRRYFEFWARGQYLAFDMLAGILTAQQAGLTSTSAGKGANVHDTQLTEHRGRRLTVYLAGGLNSGWQDQVRTSAPECEYLDPRSHGLANASAYTVWDLRAVRASDVVFAFLESTNPSGFGLSVEVGYAKALGKLIILIDEKSPSDEVLRRQLRIVQSAADVVFSELAAGIQYLRNLSGIPQA